MAQTRKQRLFNSPPGGPKTKGIKYATAKNARKSIQLIKGKDKTQRKRTAMRMYYRAKFHKHQTPGMRAAMKVWKSYMNKIPAQRGGRCIRIQEVAKVLEKTYPNLNIHDSLTSEFDLEGQEDIFSNTPPDLYFLWAGEPMDPKCLTLDQVLDILDWYNVRYNENGELRGDPSLEDEAMYPPHGFIRNRLHAHVLPPILEKQERLRAIKNLGKKKELPANINSILASFNTGLRGSLNSQLGQLNEERQLFGESLAPRRNTRRR